MKLSRGFRIPDPYDFVLGDFLMFARVIPELSQSLSESDTLNELVELGFVNKDSGNYWLSDKGIIEALQTRERFPGITFFNGEVPEDWKEHLTVDSVIERAEEVKDASEKFNVSVGRYVDDKDE